MPWIDAHMQWFVDDEMYQKIEKGEYERIGGVVRRADNKRIVKWLRIGRDISSEAINPFFKVIAHRTDLDALTNEELIEFARFVNATPSLEAANFYSGVKYSVHAIVGKYDRLISNSDRTQALEYCDEKRQALLNIFGRTYIPNLRLQVELGYVELFLDEENGTVHLNIVEGIPRAHE